MNTVVKIAGNTYVNEDCVAGAKKHLADASVDLIITDPPYGINGDRLHQHYNRNEQFVVDGYVEVPAHKYNQFSHDWIAQAERVLRPGGQIYIVSGYTNLYHVLDALRKTSLREINHIIWKYNFGVFTSTKFVSSHYHILYYAKPGGRRTFNLECRFGTAEGGDDGSPNYRDREDVWIINREYKPGVVKNKNELPTALLLKMLQYTSNEGDLVCDLFMGGFSTAKVAVALNRRFVGFEISKPIFENGVRMMRHVRPGSHLPLLRQPVMRPIENQGKTWTEEELSLLQKRYEQLVRTFPKKRALRTLCDEFGRGRWSIEKALRRSGVDFDKGLSTATLFPIQ
jgi:site-specific DNA-methyltransferase (adenine-specific)